MATPFRPPRLCLAEAAEPKNSAGWELNVHYLNATDLSGAVGVRHFSLSKQNGDRMTSI